MFVTLAAIGMAWVASERRQSEYELQIAKQLEATGATVLLGNPFVEWRRLDQTAEQPTGLRAAWGNLLGQRILSVECTHESSLNDLSRVAGLTNLLLLDVSNTRVTDLSPPVELEESEIA